MHAPDVGIHIPECHNNWQRFFRWRCVGRKGVRPLHNAMLLLMPSSERGKLTNSVTERTDEYYDGTSKTELAEGTNLRRTNQPKRETNTRNHGNERTNVSRVKQM